MSHFLFSFFFFRRREKVCADERRASVFCFFLFGKFGNATSLMWEFLNRRCRRCAGGRELIKPRSGWGFLFCFFRLVSFTLIYLWRPVKKLIISYLKLFLFYFLLLLFFFPILVCPRQAWDAWPHATSRWQHPPSPPTTPTWRLSSCEHWNTEATCDITRNFASQPIAAPDLHVTMQQCSDAAQEYWGEKNDRAT